MSEAEKSARAEVHRLLWQLQREALTAWEQYDESRARLGDTARELADAVADYSAAVRIATEAMGRRLAGG